MSSRAQLSLMCIGPKHYFASSAAGLSRKTRVIDETSIAGAQHRTSLSGPSLGHLISELSATRPGMETLRRAGETIPEEHRTYARQVTQWIVGVPVIVGTGIVGFNWLQKEIENLAGY